MYKCSHICSRNIFALTGDTSINLLTMASNRCIITEVLNAKFKEPMNSKIDLFSLHPNVYFKKGRSKKQFASSAGTVFKFHPSILHSFLSIMPKIYKMVLLAISFFFLSCSLSISQVGFVPYEVLLPITCFIPV